MKLAADQRQVFAEFRPVEVEQHGAVAHLLFRHLVEDLGRGRIFLAQPFGEAAIDTAVLVLVGDGKREDFLFGQVGKAFHGGPALRRCPRLAGIPRMSPEQTGIIAVS